MNAFTTKNSCLYISFSLCEPAGELSLILVTFICSNSKYVNTRNKGLTLFKPKDFVDQCIYVLDLAHCVLRLEYLGLLLHVLRWKLARAACVPNRLLEGHSVLSCPLAST